MTKQILELSSQGAYLHSKYNQFIIEYNDGRKIQRPIEDLGILIFAHSGLRYSHHLINQFAEHNIAVIFCNDRFHPQSFLFPFKANSTQTERFRKQALMKEPLKKQLWQTVISEKVRNQGKLLKHLHNNDGGLVALSKKIKSGDTSNIEARAARIHWQCLFQDPSYRRDVSETNINMVLNYGYAILRAAVARAIAGTGLHPSVGIHHKNKYNAYCLADDLMEPLRPLVDSVAYSIFSMEGDVSILQSHHKSELLGLLNKEVLVKNMNYPLMESLHIYTASVMESISENSNSLEIPKWLY